MMQSLLCILVTFSLLPKVESLPLTQKNRVRESRLLSWTSGGGSTTSLNVGEGNNLSSSNRERRDEEKRRKQRKDDVIIGKTSSKKGEKDYPLDPDATEQEFLRQASNLEQEVYLMTVQGKKMLNSLRLEEAEKAFDRVLELKPTVYLWQAGIVKFYLGKIEEAGNIFVRNALLYESKFGQPGSEERTWRHACELKLFHAMSISQRKKMKHDKGAAALVPRIPEFDSDDIFAKETRKVVKLIQDLFESAAEGNVPHAILSHAHLASFVQGVVSTQDRKLRQLTGWYYLGLYNDVLGRNEESRKCMKMALKLCPSSGKSDDIVHTLPLLHMSTREWFDDSGFDDDPMNPEDGCDVEEPTCTQETASQASIDPIAEKCINRDVAKLRLVELRQALRILGLNTDGSKQDLRKRLIFSLKEKAKSFL